MRVFATFFAGFASSLGIVFEIAAAMLAAFAFFRHVLTPTLGDIVRLGMKLTRKSPGSISKPLKSS
jgi:hypothetical protein